MIRTYNMFMKAFEEGNTGKSVNIIAFDLKHTKMLFLKGIEVLKSCSFADNVKIVHSNNSFEFITNGVSPHDKTYIDFTDVRVKVHEMRCFDWDQWSVRGYSRDMLHYVDHFTIEQKFAKIFKELRRFL